MPRLMRAGAGAVLAWSAGATGACAQNVAAADATRLPSVEVTAPQPRQDRKPATGGAQARRSGGRTVAVPAAAGVATAGNGEAVPQVPASAGEKTVSGAEVN